MPDTYFCDASVLVKRHIQEIGSTWFSNLADSQTGNTIIISRLSLTEVISAFNRRCRNLGLRRTDYHKIAQDFENFCFSEYQIIEITQTVTEKAKEYGYTFGGEIAGHIVGKFPHEQPLNPKSVELDIHPENDNDMFLLDANGNKRHWILELLFIDKENKIGGYFEQLL